MNATEIKNAIGAAVESRGLFIVDVTVSRDNDVVLTVEKDEGVVDLEDCVAVSRDFEAAFDREKEDYAITVSSAGLDQPFRILRQYLKAVGTEVEVALKGGRRIVATLEAADENAVTLGYKAREAVEGKKTKVLVEHHDEIAYSEINSVRPHIVFE